MTKCNILKGLLNNIELSRHPSPTTDTPAEWHKAIWFRVMRLARALGAVCVQCLAPEDNRSFFFDWPSPRAWTLANGTRNREAVPIWAQPLVCKNVFVCLNSGMVYGG